MFDIKAAFTRLNGRILTSKELDKELESMYVEGITELAPEMKMCDLFFIARDEGWIDNDEDGLFRVNLSEHPISNRKVVSIDSIR